MTNAISVMNMHNMHIPEELRISPLKAAILEKFIVLVMGTQIGKTFRVIEHIKKSLLECEQSISLIYTMNTLLNNKQFAYRLNDFKEIYGANSIVIFSSKKQTDDYLHCKTINELNGLLSHPDEEQRPRIVVMCSNAMRFKDILSENGLIGILDKKITDGSSYYREIKLYFDEIHVYIAQIRSLIEKIIILNSVKSIMGTTATPEKIFCSKDCWTSCTVLNLCDISTSNYASASDMTWLPRDDLFDFDNYKPGSPFNVQRDIDCLNIITRTLEMFPDILSNKNFCFIPGGIRQVYHRKIRNLIFKKNNNAVVVVINGTQKCVCFYKDGDSIMTQIPIAESGEVSNDIADVIESNGLKDKCLCITGHLCIGMGQTLTCQRLGPFSHAILGNIDLDNDKIYQLFGRLTGRIKDWSNYKSTIIHTSVVIMDRVKAMESCALAMMKNNIGEEITREKYLKPMREAIDNGEINGAAVQNNFTIERIKKEKKPKYNEDDFVREFFVGTEDEIFAIAKQMSRCNKLPIPKERDENGCFIISGPGCQKGQKRAYSVEELRHHAFNGGLGSHLDTLVSKLVEPGKYAKRRYVCYDDTSDSNTLRYALISLKKK